MKDLIRDYEEVSWSDEESITDEQIEASDKASKLVALENKSLSNEETPDYTWPGGRYHNRTMCLVRFTNGDDNTAPPDNSVAIHTEILAQQ